MPPKGKLSDGIISDFSQWIEAGAIDPREQADSKLKSTKIDASSHWAFQPPKEPKLPEVKNSKWGRSELDGFILAPTRRTELEPGACRFVSGVGAENILRPTGAASDARSGRRVS